LWVCGEVRLAKSGDISLILSLLMVASRVDLRYHFAIDITSELPIIQELRMMLEIEMPSVGTSRGRTLHVR
jgi:hypothetical protein